MLLHPPPGLAQHTLGLGLALMLFGIGFACRVQAPGQCHRLRLLRGQQCAIRTAQLRLLLLQAHHPSTLLFQRFFGVRIMRLFDTPALLGLGQLALQFAIARASSIKYRLRRRQLLALRGSRGCGQQSRLFRNN